MRLRVDLNFAPIPLAARDGVPRQMFKPGFVLLRIKEESPINALSCTEKCIVSHGYSPLNPMWKQPTI